MNRNDFKKLMQLKKRNKLVVKGLFLLTFGITTGFIANETAQAQAWEPNQSTTIKTGDTQYEIKWGDYLGLISNDSGLTIETLTTLNNISDQNLIFAGNIIQFGNGVTAKVVDTNGNTIAQTPLTQADKAGIAEKSQATPIKVTKTNTNTDSNTSTGTGTNTGNPVLPTLPTAPVAPPVDPTAPVLPVDPTAPVLPVDPTAPVLPVDPEVTPEKDKEEVEFNVVYLRKHDINQSGGMSEVEKVKGIVGETLTLTTDPDRYAEEGYWLVSEPTITVTVEKDMPSVIFTFVNNEVTPPEINEGQVSIHFLDEEGNSIKESKIFGGKLGENFLILGEPIEGYELVGNTEYSGVYTENAQSFNFTYKKVATPPVQEKATIAVKAVDTEGNILSETTVEGILNEATTVQAPTVEGYTLQGNATQSVVAVDGAVATFTFVKDEVAPPVEETADVTIKHVSTEGEVLASSNITANVGETVTGMAESFDGYTLQGNATQSITATQGAVMTFTYVKDEVVVPPVENVTVLVKHVGSDGTVLGTTPNTVVSGENFTANAQTFEGYTLSGANSQTIVASEGAVITFNYTKNVVAPPEVGEWGQRPTSNSELASGEWNGTWYRDTVGNSGMILPTDSDADMWAVEYMFSEAGKDIKGYWSWEVRMQGTNEIRVTVDFY